MSIEALRALEKKWEDRAQSLAEQIGEQRDSDFGNMAAGFLRLQMDEVDRCRSELAALLTTRQEVAPVADLAIAVRMLLDSAPPHMTPRNAKEREAYKLLRKLMEKETA